eukprot:COSAG04_NODE_3019_length_3273_cov_2.829553_7_plen_84_part_00
MSVWRQCRVCNRATVSIITRLRQPAAALQHTTQPQTAQLNPPDLSTQVAAAQLLTGRTVEGGGRGSSGLTAARCPESLAGCAA